jgi:2-succinyl-6-hydroxy-2,4-cyclohexadiene-1-carboxylate synthase
MPKVVALHGFTGSGKDFEPLRECLDSRFEVMAPDFPGHGHLLHQDRPTDYSLNAHLNVISDAAGDYNEPITLLGYSMGGRLALHWALAHPERVRRLILIGASPGLLTSDEQAERIRGDRALAQFIRSEGLNKFLKYWNTKTFFKPLLALPPERLDPILIRRQKNSTEALALSLEHVGTGILPSLWERLIAIKCPTDLVVGEHDGKFIEIAHAMAERMPKSRMSIIEDAGHAVHLEKPQDLATLIEG